MIKEGDKFVLHSSNGMDYNIKVININNFREPEMKYACDVIDGNGICSDDVMFFGDDFFKQDCIDKIGD